MKRSQARKKKVSSHTLNKINKYEQKNKKKQQATSFVVHITSKTTQVYVRSINNFMHSELKK